MVSSAAGGSALSAEFSVQMVHPSRGNWGQFSMREASSPFWYCCRVICRGVGKGGVVTEGRVGGAKETWPGWKLSPGKRA